MSARTATAPAPGFEASLDVPHHVDDLLTRPAPVLSELYAQASVPTLSDVHGALRGRMLATTVLPPVLDGLARAWAGTRLFPWRGKSFAPHDDERGEGINRVIADRWHLYRFETSIGPSRAGDFDALQLDYDLPENPFFIRPIEDEMRELRPGLYLGQAYLRWRNRSHLVLYFGLQQA